MAVRANPDIIIAQGNHSAHNINYQRKVKYTAGNKLGLDMHHFQMRSVTQVETKYWNGAKAQLLGEKLGVLSKEYSNHWSSFKADVQEKGLRQAAMDRFNKNTQLKENCVQDPLPMLQAIKLFEELTSSN